MNILDIIIAIPLLCGLWQGYRQGLIVQIIGLATLFAGAYCAFAFGTRAGTMIGLSGLTASATGFILVFLLTMVVLYFLGRLARGVFRIAGLGIFDTLLGIVFSLLKVSLVTGLLLIWLEQIDTGQKVISQQTAASSHLYGPVVRTARTAFPYMESIKNTVLNLPGGENEHD